MDNDKRRRAARRPVRYGGHQLTAAYGSRTGAAGRLAVEGGTPVRTRPIRTRTEPTPEDIAAATRVLSSGQLSGPDHAEVKRFESLLAQSSGVAHAVAVNSGTAAIHCILLALGVGPGDEVIVPAHTFIATATPILMVGATPVVVDVTPDSYCIDPAAVDAAVTGRTKAIVAVHINGHPAPVDLLPSHLPIISDACQAHGATLFDTPVGALGVASAFSFWQDKLITAAGEGGAVVTADPDIAGSVRLVRSHAQQQIPGTANSQHISLGFNYRLTAVQAAMGHSQLARLPAIVDARCRNAERLSDLLAGAPGVTPPASRAGATHVYWKFVVALEPDRFRAPLHDVIRLLAAEGIPATPRYPIPLSRQPVMRNSARIAPCPVAESLVERLLVLPLPATDAAAGDVDDIANAVAKVATALMR